MKVSVIVTALATAAHLVEAVPGVGGMSREEIKELLHNNWKRIDAEGGYEVKGAGWHHKRYLEEEAEEMKLEKRWTNNWATGVTYEDPPRVPRREIRALATLRIPGKPNSTALPWYLFLMALNRWYDTNSNTNPVGYFQLAGVHGQPYVEWNNDGNGNGGPYCTHGSTLFPPWHRPYLALVEEQIFYHAKVIATQAKFQKWDWRDALKQIRLPYYDTSNNAGYPDLLRATTFVVPQDPFTGARTTYRNPLYQYPFKSNIQNSFQTSGDDDRFRRWSTTKRCPNGMHTEATTQSGTVANRLGAQGSTLRSRARAMFQQSNSWPAFSNNLASGGNPNNVETIHDAIHVAAGGDGHMSVVPFSSFDPLFWIHHANTDRLYAMWQCINFGVNVSPRNAEYTTWTTQRGQEENINTPLRPWRNRDGNSWTSRTVTNHEGFGYTYDDAPRGNYNTDTQAGRNSLRNFVLNRVNQLYPSSMQAVALAKRDDLIPGINVTESLPPVTEELINGLEESIVDGKFSEWRIDCSVDQTATGGSFSVHFFFGRPPKDPKEWPVAKNLIGSFPVFTHGMTPQGLDPETVDSIVLGSVPLTDALAGQFALDGLHSLKPEDVIDYLTKKLRWRVQTVTGERVPVRRVKDLKVKIFRADATRPTEEDPLGTVGPFTEVGEIVRKIGKEGGDLAPGVLPPTSEHATDEDREDARRRGIKF